VGDLRGREWQRGELGERRPTPKRKRLAQHRGGLVGVARGQRPSTVGDPLLEALGVELAWLQPQAVAGGRGGEHVGVAERPAQA
jgi:hypothetical protein